MRKLILAAAMAALVSPAWAQSGRIACENELAEFVGWSEANPQAARTGDDDWIEVLAAQCRYSPRLAEASMASLRQRMDSSQVAHGTDSVEWSGVADRAD